MANPKMKVVIGAENQMGGALRSARDDIADLSHQAKTTSDSMDKLGTSVGGWMKGIATAFVANEIRKFATDSIQAFSSLNESINKSQVVFKDSAGTIAAFAKTAARNLGMSQQAATEAAGTFGNLFTSMGLGVKQSADMSVGLVKLAADLASFNNIDPSVALEKLRAGMVGEVEPLRALGINLSAAAVNAKAYAMGLAQVGETVSMAALLQARYALALEQSSNAQGDFERTATGLANSQRIAAAATKEFQAALGALIAPAYTVGIQAITKSVEDLTAAINEGQYRNGADPVLEWLLRNTPAALAANTELALATKARIAAEQALQRELGGSDQGMIRFAQNNLIAAQEAEGAALRNKLLSDGLSDVARNAGIAAAGIGDYVDRLRDIVPAIASIGPTLAQPGTGGMPWRPGQGQGPDPFLKLDQGADTGLRSALDKRYDPQRKVAEEAQRAWLAAAKTTEKAFDSAASSLVSTFQNAMSASVGLSDLRGKSGVGGLLGEGLYKPGSNGPFEDIYRLQAWVNDSSHGDIAAKFNIASKEDAASRIGKFQSGLWDESVTSMIDENKLKQAVLTEKQAETYKRAFAEKIANATGVGTDVAAAAIYGTAYTSAEGQTAKMTGVATNMAGGLINGIVKAGPDLEKAGYDNAMAYRAGWAAGMSDGASGGSAKPPTGSGGYRGAGRELGD